jgi:hypothetical protein
MFNKESCRACGTFLTPISVCNFCRVFRGYVANVKEWKMLLICMTIVELFIRRKSKKLEISENKYQQLYNYLQHFNIKTIEIKSSIH